MAVRLAVMFMDKSALKSKPWRLRPTCNTRTSARVSGFSKTIFYHNGADFSSSVDLLRNSNAELPQLLHHRFQNRVQGKNIFRHCICSWSVDVMSRSGHGIHFLRTRKYSFVSHLSADIDQDPNAEILAPAFQIHTLRAVMDILLISTEGYFGFTTWYIIIPMTHSSRRKNTKQTIVRQQHFFHFFLFECASTLNSSRKEPCLDLL